MRRVLSLAGAAAIVAALGISVAGAQPTPPTRFFGTAQLDGRAAPDGTTITALVAGKNCGTGSVTGGSYTVDVASATTLPGCGTDGATVNFQVGTASATQTGTFQTGAFVSLNLTAQAATPTPSPTPARTATPVPATPTRTATAIPATAAPQRPAGSPVAQRPAAPAAAPALPRTGADATDSPATGAVAALAGIVALGGAGIAAFRRRR